MLPTPAMVSQERGFTLIDVTFATLITGIVMAIAIPMVDTARERYQVASGAREIAAQIRLARLTALSTNRAIRVRFNCPAARQFRFVEFVNDPTIDAADDRCDLGAYPYPNPNPAVAPNQDGPVLTLPGIVAIRAAQDLHIDRTGRVTALAGGMPATITLGNRNDTRNIVVSVSGRVQVP